MQELPSVAVDDLIDNARLRSYHAAHWAARSDRGLEVFGYDQGMQVLEHPQLLKGPSFQYRLDQLGVRGEARRYMDMGITSKEGEERRQMRASMGALFRPAQVAKLREGIRDIAHRMLDEIGDAPDEADLMRLCWEIPARTYCDLVSIPHDRSDTVIRIADSVLGTLLTVDVRRREEAEAAILESVDIVREHLNVRRGHSGDDFTSVMIRQQEDGLMTEEQLVAQSFALLQASVDNTAHQMGNTFGMLLSEPARWQQYTQDRELRSRIIEESVRLYPRFGTIFRLADSDVVIDDVVIPEGAWAFVSVRAGQRDPAVFEDPDTYRLDRNGVRPLMFGAGPYNCLGQNLARMEIEEALEAVAERYPQIALTGNWERKQANAVSETASLRVDLGRQRSRRPAIASTPIEQSSRPAVASSEPEVMNHRRAGERVIDCRLERVQRVATDIVSLELAALDGSELPAWEAGSHIDLVLPDGQIRQYSLCGPREDRSRYRIAVLREVEGSGGSAYVHDHLAMNQPLQLRGPRNNFPLEPATAYRFVAGGIGITAILPMVLEAHRRGADWTLLYMGRSIDRLAFRDELARLPAERVQLVSPPEGSFVPMEEILGPIRPDALLYACGPGGLLSALGSSAWPEERIRFERFAPDRPALAAPRGAFEVTLTQSGKTLDVPADKSILDVVDEAGVAWPYSCREGTCGSCEARIVAGRADHRDAVLTPAERRANEFMMICVSRSQTPTLSLEI